MFHVPSYNLSPLFIRQVVSCTRPLRDKNYKLPPPCCFSNSWRWSGGAGTRWASAARMVSWLMVWAGPTTCLHTTVTVVRISRNHFQFSTQLCKLLISAGIPLSCWFPACPDAAYVILLAFSPVVFTCWAKSSERERSVLLPPKYKTESQWPVG